MIENQNKTTQKMEQGSLTMEQENLFCWTDVHFQNFLFLFVDQVFYNMNTDQQGSRNRNVQHNAPGKVSHCFRWYRWHQLPHRYRDRWWILRQSELRDEMIPGFGMTHFRNNTWNNRNIELEQLMSNPVIDDCADGWIAINNLAHAIGRRVAQVSGFKRR